MARSRPLRPRVFSVLAIPNQPIIALMVAETNQGGQYSIHAGLNSFSIFYVAQENVDDAL